MDWHRYENTRQVRINQEGELVYLTFPVLEEIDWVSHLFSTRIGGVSEGIFASMNLSYTRGDKKDAVDENYRRIATALGCRVEDIVCSDQTHTTNLKVVGREDGGKGITRPKDYQDVDGLLTDEPGVYLATFYSDCVPLYFVDVKKRAIALAHSGWRGTVARMG
ncbi:MAG: polyphenol oxidase family protein, partial [Lachnospiraceae bacterium]|nr:polyphenol oxidase family protein [Lachnospiraceae bacterium]